MEHIQRFVKGKESKLTEKEHLARYNFSLEYVGGKRVLDIACGTGYGTKIIASKAKEVIGVDISSEVIYYAKKNYSRENIIFYQGDATNLHFLKDDTFDCVVSFETIEHIPNYKKYLKEMHRLLKPRGLYIVSTPNKKYASPGLSKPKNPFHVIEFYLNDFKKLLNNYFSDIKIYGQAPSVESLMPEFIKKLIPEKIREAIIIPLAFILASKNPYCIRRSFKVRDKIVDKNIDECLNFIAICNK